MKLNKKNPRKQLEKFSNVFMQLGLVLALFVVFITLEHQTKEKELAIVDLGMVVQEEFDMSDLPPVIRVERPKATIVKSKPAPSNILDKVDVVKNNKKIIEEVILKPQDEDKPSVVVLPKIDEEVEPEEIDDKDDPVSMNFVSEIPVFAGCEGLSKAKARKCFDKKIKRIVQRHFNADLANELGLSSGKKRISTQFVIDKAGNITDVRVRAPHPRLKKEAKRIVKKIPKFTPGKQNGKTVKVRYTLPITFKVE